MKDLFRLLNCHSTPGDEDETATLLLKKWQECGMETESYGRYAVSATKTENWNPDAPTLLVCAHMDSPGFSVESFDEENNRIRVIKMGGPSFDEREVPVILKTDTEKIETILTKTKDKETDRDIYFIPVHEGVKHGDRVCFEAEAEICEGNLLKSPFIDNRIGCYILCRIAEIIDSFRCMNIVLGATASEEMGGYGANVLAREVEPDLVICLDATYQAEKQGIFIGYGPVLTLSDAAVILGCKTRNTMIKLFEDHNLPLQTEVYNFSGTDARAFPNQGIMCPVLPLLIPSEGNHSPVETASLDDVETLINAIQVLADKSEEYGLLNGFSD